MEGFKLSWQAEDGVCVIRPVGDLDIITSRQLDEALVEARRSFKQVVLDLSGVEFMDTSSLAVIVGHWKSLEEVSGSLALAGARYQSTRSLWITGLADRIPLYQSVRLALDAARSDDHGSEGGAAGE
ncbi:MAG TPA: STAS domain-containing protein [Streptosporangiaceae bacterium]|nr:STAS domain-containing protein [Streptosporangiaceae bacterium]